MFFGPINRARSKKKKKKTWDYEEIFFSLSCGSEIRKSREYQNSLPVTVVLTSGLFMTRFALMKGFVCYLFIQKAM